MRDRAPPIKVDEVRAEFPRRANGCATSKPISPNAMPPPNPTPGRPTVKRARAVLDHAKAVM